MKFYTNSLKKYIWYKSGYTYVAISRGGRVFELSGGKIYLGQEIPLKEVFAWMKEHDIKLEDLRS